MCIYFNLFIQEILNVLFKFFLIFFRYAEQKESEYWNNKEIEAKEKIKSLVDKHNINTSKSMKRQKSSRIKKIKEKHIKKKSFVELKTTTKTKGKLVSNNNGSNKDKSSYKNGVNRNNDINNNGKISMASYYTTPLQSSENSEFGEANNVSDNEGRYENEEMLKYDYDDDEYENFTPAAIAGSWEPFVKDVATIQQDPCTGTLIVFLNWFVFKLKPFIFKFLKKKKKNRYWLILFSLIIIGKMDIVHHTLIK
jgi:hypothetical protein